MYTIKELTEVEREATQEEWKAYLLKKHMMNTNLSTKQSAYSVGQVVLYDRGIVDDPIPALIISAYMIGDHIQYDILIDEGNSNTSATEDQLSEIV